MTRGEKLGDVAGDVLEWTCGQEPLIAFVAFIVFFAFASKN